VIEEGTDEQLLNSVLQTQRQQGRFALGHIAARGLLFPLRVWVGRWGELAYTCLYFRPLRPVDKFNLSLHLGTYPLHYPVPYSLLVMVYDVPGYNDSYPFTYVIESGPARLGSRAHCCLNTCAHDS